MNLAYRSSCMRRHYWLILTLLLALMSFALVGAQDIEPMVAPPEDADVAISFPPPVFVINGSVEIRGTADALDMINYFVEYRPLAATDPVSLATATPCTSRATSSRGRSRASRVRRTVHALHRRSERTGGHFAPGGTTPRPPVARYAGRARGARRAPSGRGRPRTAR